MKFKFCLLCHLYMVVYVIMVCVCVFVVSCLATKVFIDKLNMLVGGCTCVYMPVVCCVAYIIRTHVHVRMYG